MSGRGPGRRRLRRAAYGIFYTLPISWRRRLVRLVMAKYVVGAVALVYDSESERPRLLLLRQPGAVGWTLPAGLLKRGEHPREGCARELAEETGLVVPPKELKPAHPHAVVHTRGSWVDIVFEVRVPASTAGLAVDGAEVLHAEFHPIDNLPPLTHSTARLLSYFDIGPYVEYPEVRV